MSIRRPTTSVKGQKSDDESLIPLTKNGYPLELDTGSIRIGSQALSTSPPSCWCDKVGRRVLQLVSLSVFLISSVANSDILQRITTGGRILGMENHEAYDKPVFITWYSYNYMILSLLFVMVPLTTNKHHFQHNKNAINQRDTPVGLCGSFIHYFLHIWPGKLGLPRAMLSCLVISWLLQFLNVLMIVGLKCISISLSNTLYQLEAGFTLALSVGLLNDPLDKSKVAGIFVSMIGIAWIMAPALFSSADSEIAATSTDHDNMDGQCGSISLPLLWGSMVTLLSAAMGAFYLVSWRIFDEKRDRSISTSHLASTSLDDLVDNQMTLAMIGVCNLLAGWPLIIFAHMTGLEGFQWPDAATTSGDPIGTGWRVMILNAGVEYLFDASCAIAIYVTSPLTVAVVSPLTIPLSMIVEHYSAYYLMETQDGEGFAATSGFEFSTVVSSVGGTLVILIGVWLMEAKSQWLT